MGILTISVCIATYKRPELLKKLLVSLDNQKNIDDYTVEIIIVENDSNALSKNIVDNFTKNISANKKFIVKYDIEPIKNIALTRNKTVALATGNYLFFIDDDEYADDYWIYNHMVILLKFNADGTFGPVLPYFEDNDKMWLKNCYVYTKRYNPTGAKPASLYTSNCAIKKNTFDKNFKLFDPAYGITGGSDHELFTRLVHNGHNFVSVAEAKVFELIPEQRANIKWLIQRVFRTGNNYTRTLILKNGKQSFLLSLAQFIMGLLQSLIALFLSLLLLWDRTKSLNWFLKSVSNIAKPFAVFGYYPKEYKN